MTYHHSLSAISKTPNKKLWSKIITQTIDIHEENNWKESVHGRNELRRFYQIHCKLTEHRLLRLASTDRQENTKLITMVNLGSMAIKDGNCTLCNHYTHDILEHLVLYCEHLIDDRNHMFYSVVNLLPVNDSVPFFQQDDDEILITLLGGVTEFIQTIESELWK